HGRGGAATPPALQPGMSCVQTAGARQPRGAERAQCHGGVGHARVMASLRGWYTVCPPAPSAPPAEGMAAAQRPREGIVRIGFLMGRSFTEDRHQADILRWLRQWGATAEPLHLGDDLIDVAR